MKFKELIKKSMSDVPENISHISALLSIVISIHAVSLVDFYDFGKTKTVLFFTGVVFAGYFLFLVLRLIINALNNVKIYVESVHNSKDLLWLIIAALIFGPFLIMQLYNLISAISDAASADVIKSGVIYFSLGLIVALIIVFKDKVKKFLSYSHEQINSFLLSKEKVKAIPIILTLLTVGLFLYLIIQSYNAHKIDSSIGEDIGALSIGIVFVPLLVFLVSGCIVNNIYLKSENDTFDKVLDVSLIVLDLIVLGILTIFMKPIFIITTSDFNPDNLKLFAVYLAFTIFLIKHLVSTVLKFKDRIGEE